MLGYPVGEHGQERVLVKTHKREQTYGETCRELTQSTATDVVLLTGEAGGVCYRTLVCQIFSEQKGEKSPKQTGCCLKIALSVFFDLVSSASMYGIA